MNPFIVLEGADGTGKTTVGTLLAERIGGRYVITPGEEYKPIRSHIDDRVHQDAKLLFYLSSVVDASHKIAGALSQMPVVCDRYVWSSLIPHSVYYSEPLENLERQWSPLIERLTRPTHTVLLKASEEEQLRRLSTRKNGSISASDRNCLNDVSRKRLRELYDQVSLRENWLEIDTTNISQTAVVDKILKECEVQVLA